MNAYKQSPTSDAQWVQLSPGEIHFLWWFIQGSIMNPSTRDRLRKAWGMCERHAWGWMAVEASFRGGYMHGPAVLYEDVICRALAAFDLQGPLRHERLKQRLRSKGPCLMCEEGYGADSIGMIKPERVEKGRDLGLLLTFAQSTSPYWRRNVCGLCSGDGSTVRCRRHLIEDQSGGLVQDLLPHRSLVSNLARHMTKFARSFQVEFQRTQTLEDASALISCVGWLSGWGAFLRIVDLSTVKTQKLLRCFQ
ncbi:MAG: hypothetical protein M0T73_07495 [Deltaproteobacteria bacterium]|nr:hypothetical protein [Deltaproteobacteria bacterium]